MEEKHEGAPSAPMDLRVWVRLLSCAMRIEKQLRRNFAEQFDTTLPRFDVMASLDRYPKGQTMGELSRALLVSNGNTTSIVRQLESSGLVTSRPDPRDLRSSIVMLTSDGKKQFALLAAAHHRWVKNAMSNFPADKQKKLFNLLADLNNSIGKV
jgi:DNA-binding MarR family transcriptional regulator